MTGPDVNTMQKHLLALKYDLGNDGADGDFAGQDAGRHQGIPPDAGC
jgi:hypothetical protein